MTFAGSSALEVPHDKRVSIDVNDLSVMIPSDDDEKGTTAILDHVSFKLATNNIMAIMGGSGSGKTTLLNVLAQRTNVRSSALKFSGSITYSFPEPTSKMRISTAYMVQEDFFMPGLTLKETLLYQAELRLGSASKDTRLELIDSLLQLLHLHPRKDEIVKTFTGNINLSGGEQRRLSLAVQLLSRPQLLFLDEPTTGLDTSSALTLVSILKRLASPEIGITIVLSIHQPRAEVLTLFDRLCVLTRGGRMLYFGSLAESVAYFSSLEGTGIVDKVDSSVDSYATINRIMFMSVKNTSSEEKERESMKLVDFLVKQWRSKNPPPIESSIVEQKAKFQENLKLFKTFEPLPLHRELVVLTRRAMIISLRDTSSLLSLHGGSAFIAIVIGWLFYKPDPNLSGIRSITSCLYTVLEFLGFVPLTMELARLWEADGVCFFKEYKECCISIPGFIISRRVCKLLVEDAPMVLIYSIITYFMWGLRVGENYSDSGDGSYFGVYLAICLVVGICSMSLAMLCFALGKSFSVSLMFSNLVYQLQNSGCGYFVNSATMPVYVRWVKYLAFFWYAFGAYVSNQYSGWQGNCPYPEGSAQCEEYGGDYQLSVLGFPSGWIGAPIGYLVLWAVGINFVSAVAFYFRNYDVEFAKKKKNRIGDDKLPSSMETTQSSCSQISEKFRDSETSPSVDLSNVTLAIKVKDSPLPWAKSSSRVLLNNVSAYFKPNSVNVIMGPSGGGKTTLLNLLANRLGTGSFKRNGMICLNGSQEVNPFEISNISGYVMQTDNLLIPELTVRETLYYQACMRLPINVHDRIPSYLNTLMRQMGIIDCADTPIGSENTKGISGGEKRRVSIAIQLLGRPQILFLDEPTSGLDSATSVSILALLKQLADSGCTVITTLHQPSKDMFTEFDSLVLLARGGHVVYNGATYKVPTYFSDKGFPCPKYDNIADHILDLMSIRPGETSEVLQARVDYLIQSWQDAESMHDIKSLNAETIDVKRNKKKNIPWLVLFKAICGRQFLVSFRTTDILVARVWTVIVVGVIYALFFSPLKNTQEGISNRLGLTQNITNLFFCGLINNLSIYPSQRDLFHQEYRDKAYGSTLFSCAYLLAELPFEILPSVFFSAMVVFVIGLPRTPEMFFSTFFCSIAAINCGESSGIFFNSIFKQMGVVTVILNDVFMIGIIMAGTMSLQAPEFFKAWNYINPTKYIVQICTNLGFANQTFSCSGSTCTLRTGEEVLEAYGLKAQLSSSFGALVACLVIYRLVSFGAEYTRVRWYL